jgi:hypothetical protein
MNIVATGFEDVFVEGCAEDFGGEEGVGVVGVDGEFEGGIQEGGVHLLPGNPFYSHTYVDSGCPWN